MKASSGEPKPIFVVDAHPDANSLCAALAEAYVRGAEAGGHDVRVSKLRDLTFDLVLRGGYDGGQREEPDLLAQRDNVLWCRHLVIVSPNWWSGPPALLKGWIDRVFVPDFAMRYKEAFPYVEPLLGGRSARVIYTENAPLWLTRMTRVGLYWRVMKRAVLKHCGFAPVRRTELAEVAKSTPDERAAWLERVSRLGARGA